MPLLSEPVPAARLAAGRQRRHDRDVRVVAPLAGAFLYTRSGSRLPNSPLSLRLGLRGVLGIWRAVGAT